MPEPFHPTAWFRRPLTAGLLVATVCGNAWILEHTYLPIPRDVWSGFCVSQLSLLAWWVAPVHRGWEPRFCLALVAGAILVISAHQFGIYQGVMWFVWHSAIVFFFVWAYRYSTVPVRNPMEVRLHVSLKSLFLLTAIVAVGFGAHSFGRETWIERPWSLNYTSRDGQIISGIVLGVLVPAQFVRRLPGDLVNWMILFLTCAVTGICILLGAFSYDPCVYFETIREVTPFNLAQALIFVIWLTALRIESNWRECRFASGGA